MSARAPSLRAMCALLLVAGACSPYVQHGGTLYRQGRYIEAAEVFERTEDRLAASDGAVCAEYGLYRGLTFLELDDLPSARIWLAYASRLEQKSPGRLNATDRSRLARAWAALQRRSRSAPVEPTTSVARVASATDAAPAHGVGASPNGRRSPLAE